MGNHSFFPLFPLVFPTTKKIERILSPHAILPWPRCCSSLSLPSEANLHHHCIFGPSLHRKNFALQCNGDDRLTLSVCCLLCCLLSSLLTKPTVFCRRQCRRSLRRSPLLFLLFRFSSLKRTGMTHSAIDDVDKKILPCDWSKAHVKLFRKINFSSICRSLNRNFTRMIFLAIFSSVLEVALVRPALPPNKTLRMDTEIR